MPVVCDAASTSARLRSIQVPVPKKKVKARHPKKKVQQKHGTWQVQTAKACFSELVRRARAEGPQIVTKQGKEDVVVLPVEQYRRLTKRSQRSMSLAQFFAQSPLASVELNLERERDYGRNIEL
jgi:prevent-host-death family protein